MIVHATYVLNESITNLCQWNIEWSIASDFRDATGGMLDQSTYLLSLDLHASPVTHAAAELGSWAMFGRFNLPFCINNPGAFTISQMAFDQSGAKVAACLSMVLP